MSLLERTRKINRLLQRAGQHVDFKEMAEVVREAIGANVYVLSRGGKVLGYAIGHETRPIGGDEVHLAQLALPAEYNNRLLRYEETAANLSEQTPLSLMPEVFGSVDPADYTTVLPVVGGGQRLGTVIVARSGQAFNEEDLVLGEYAATVVGMEILRSRTQEVEEDTRSRAVVQMAVSTLSFSELEAVEHIFDELQGKEGLLVASKIADRAGITRSVIVNALRKLESAGVIESRSLGMKGTYIRVLNEKLIPQLDRVRRR
jgi:transcriptional pleiotropic repressor